MTYGDARTIEPGDTIRYMAGAGMREQTVTGPIHVFKRDRGMVVFVPVRGELVVHTRIVGVARG